MKENPAVVVEYGEVFTRRWIVETLLDLVSYDPARPLHELVLVEPSVGSGAFLIPIVERLIESAQRDQVPMGSLSAAIWARDLQQAHVDVSRKAVSNLLQQSGLTPTSADGLASTWIRQADYLLDEEIVAADIVVGNPPYIRSDELDKRTEATYRHLWPTMKGRADIFVGFYEKGLVSLKPGGKLGFICADRWMRNAYGANLRRLVGDQFSVETLWQMHDVDAFEAEVSAYPAITVLSRQKQGQVLVADTTSEFEEASAKELIAFGRDKSERLDGVGYKAHKVDGWFKGEALWPSGDPDRIALLEYLNDHFEPLQNPATATKIGIGVATGADQAYLTADPKSVEDGRALPIAMAKDIRSGTFKWGGQYMLNPWGNDGHLIDIESHPKMKAALEAHDSIKKRFVAKKNPDKWHRTIDKVNPALINTPKLYLRDMSATIQPVYDSGGFYPHHNLYYVVSDHWDMQVLGGILLSRIAQAFVDSYGVKMRGGTMRFQAQYLRMIRVPDPTRIPADVAQELRVAFEQRDVDAATRAAERAYGLPKEMCESDA